MTRDSERKPDDLADQGEETGATEGRKGKSTVSDEASGENADASDLKEIQVALVDEVLQAESQGDVVDAVVYPAGEVSQLETAWVGTIDAGDFEASRIRDEIDRVVEPARPVDQLPEQLSVPVAAGLQAVSLSPSVVNMVMPQREAEVKDDLGIVSLQELTAEQIDQRVDQQMTLESQRSQGRVQLEIDEDDPVFGWTGGSPYGSVQPKLVIHRRREGVATLPFLQLLLRDTYKELEGGEPGADTVEFVANEPRIPQVQKNIVTLDLTGSEWQATVRNGNPVIERNNVDIVPTLQEVASTLYTGELGYFVVNIPDEWEGDVVRRNFFDELVARVIQGTVPEDDESGVFELVRSSPVVMAKPRVETDRELFTNVTQYFSLSEDDVDRFESVDQVAAVQERALRRNDWKRIAVTKRQRTDDESDEHYFWKALLADGLAWEMKQWFDQERNNSDADFETFLQEDVLKEDRIRTEETVNENDESIVADLYVPFERSPSWVADAITEFFDTENYDGWDIAVECETGRSEGAFNFRKLRESLEKYAEEGVPPLHICVMLPSRLFYRGERRARMILDLVEKWDELQQGEQLSADMFVPEVQDGYCHGLQTGADIVDELYGGEDE